MKRIFQYSDPTDTQDDTRWIAARDAQLADAEAARRGWVKEFADNEIFEHDQHGRRGWTKDSYQRAGCDVVL